MSALLARAVRPRTRWVIIGIWLVAVFACFGFNLPGKFSDAERNESSSYLPSDAESTRALDATKRLTNGEQAAMVIVYRREGGLTAADRAADRRERGAPQRASLSPAPAHPRSRVPVERHIAGSHRRARHRQHHV